MAEDKPRLLAAQSELGYTSSGYQALSGAGEAVPEEVQRDITAASQHRSQAGRREQLEQIRSHLKREIAHLDAQLRHKQRELRRVDSRLDTPHRAT
jgi:septal ring factor EnvC (AmiA/AmiB activator)